MTLEPLPNLFQRHSWHGAAQGGGGEAGKVSVEGSPLCPNFFRLFLFSEGYQITNKGLEKKQQQQQHCVVLKFAGESPLSLSSLNLSPFF